MLHLKFFNKEPSGGGRPRLILNEDGKRMIRTLAGLMATEEEIAKSMDTTVETLHSKWNKETFLECKEKGMAQGKVSLRRYQFAQAEKSPAMAIWLGKQWLGQSDRVTVENKELEKDPLSVAFEELMK